MSVRVERSSRVLTVIRSHPEARNAVDPEHAEALYEAFVAFDKDATADVAVFWGEGGAFCAGADLKRVATRDNRKLRNVLDFPKDGGAIPRGPMGRQGWNSPSFRSGVGMIADRHVWTSDP